MNPVTMQLIADKYIRLALEEDISSEDVFTNSVMPEYRKGRVQPIYRGDGIIARLQTFERVFILPDPEAKVVLDVRDGEEVKKGQHLVTVTEDVRVPLSDKWAALNYLRRLGGVVIYTHTVVGMFEGIGIRLLDTRKTTPYTYIFEEYAMRIGGGQNHRYDLPSDVLSKDNHIGAAGGTREAITATRVYAPSVRRVKVETENLDTVKEAVNAGIDIIILNNMTPEQMVETIRYTDGRVEIEYSGSMTKESIRTIIELGVDYVSSGALTHSSPILGISLKRLGVLAD